jgi:subtilase family serine protease
MLETRQLLSTGAVASSAASTTIQPFVQVSPMAGAGSTAYSPQQIAAAYGINGISFSGVSGNGSGQTIAIVDAYSDPNIQSDLAAFNAHFGLSAPPSFTVDNLGATTTDPGWSLETALDVEWAHAIAPKANIVLVEAPDSTLNSLLNAVHTAASLPNVSVVSMSWGTNEFYGEWNLENLFNTPAGHTGETFVAASGDSGAWSGPSFPAVAPNVLAVGGSTLTLGSGNSYGSETGWTYSTGGFSGLDNGFSYGVSVPSYQVSTLNAAGLNYGLRTTPDVSLNADPNTGFAVYASVPNSSQSGWFDVGGTSAAAPAWAGLVAITDQGLAASGKSTLTTTQLLNNLYSLPSSDFHAITAGFNGYNAGSGYNLVTGLGTPQANRLVPGLLAANGVNPASGTTTTAASSQPASTSATVHKAVVVTASSTPSAGVVSATAIASATFSAGFSALTTQSATASTTAGLSGAAAQGSSVAGASATPSGAAIGLGQGTSSSSVSIGSVVTVDTEQPNLGIDMIDTGQDASSGTPESPAPQTPTPETPISPRSTPEEILPESAPGSSPQAAPMVPSSDSLDSTLGAVEAAIARLLASGPARIEPAEQHDEGQSVRSAGEDGGAAQGLVAVGAIVVLGQRIVSERGRRRRTSSWLLRSSGR